MRISTEKLKEDFNTLLQAEYGFQQEKSSKAVYNALCKAVMLNLSKDWNNSRKEGRMCSLS